MSLVLLGTCVVIVLADVLLVRRMGAARPYRRAWRAGVTAPVAAQAIVLLFTLMLTTPCLSCSQESTIAAMQLITSRT